MKKEIINLLFENFEELVQNPYGNYAIQHAFDIYAKECGILFEKVIDRIVQYSNQKFSSNVVEKCISIGTPEIRKKYVKEINSNVLEWTPVHSERFWRENVRKFEENDFQYIRKLVMLLDESNILVRDKNQAIGCYDLGEFCRFHPFGKNVLDKLDAKQSILKLIESDNPTVKENALVAIQKIMLQSWQNANLTGDDEKSEKAEKK